MSSEREAAPPTRLEYTPDELRLRRRIAFGIAVAMSVLVSLALLFWQSTRQAADNLEQATYIRAARNKIAASVKDLLDSQNRVRGFALTGEQAFLEPYLAAKSALLKDLSQLRKLMAENPAQQTRFNALEPRAFEALSLADQIVAARRSGREPIPVELLRRHEQEVDAVLALSQGLEAAESTLLAVRARTALAMRQRLVMFTAVFSLLGAVLLLVAGFFIYRAVDAAASARVQIKAINSTLEQRVEERTAELQRQIAERKRTAAELQKQAQLLDLAHDAIIVRDLQGRILYWNRGAEQMYGWSARESNGQIIHDFLATRFPTPLRNIEAALALKGEWEGELQHTTRQGARVIAASRWSIQLDEQHQAAAVLEIGRDITDRKQAEQELRESQERQAGIIASAMDAILSVDNAQRIVLFNSAAEKMFRRPAQQVLGQPLSLLVPQRFQAVHARYVKQFTRSQAGSRALGAMGNLWAVRADGEEFQIEASISQVTTAGKKLYTVILRDITERLRTEAALRNNEEMLRLLLDGVKDYAVYMLDPAGRVATWNAGAARIKGYTAEEIVGRSISTFDPPAQQAGGFTDLALRQALTTGRFEGRGERVRKDGSTFWAHVVILPMYDLAGKLRGFSKVLHDISEQKQAEDALQVSEQRFHTLANSMPQLAWIAEADGHIFWYNQRWHEYTGTTPEQMKRDGWQPLHHPDVLPRVTETWNGAIASGLPLDMEFPLLGADGRFRSFLTRVVPMKDASGCVTQWFGTNTDISERKEAEEKLTVQAQALSRQTVELTRSQEAHEIQTRLLKSVLDSVSEGLIAADAQGNFLIWNPAAMRLIGKGPEEIPPAGWAQHYGIYLPDAVTPFPDDQDPLARAIQGAYSTAEIFVRNSGCQPGAWLEVTGAPIRDRSGVVTGGVVAFRDFTQRRKDELRIRKFNDELERRVSQRTAQLEEANKELEAFTYSVAHDLRAPLRHIAGYSGTLLEELGATCNEAAALYLRRIQDGTQRMGRLVDELLTLAQVGRKSPNMEVVGLNSIVQEVMGILQPEMQGRQVEWKIAALPFVECDATLLMQVFQNLISNALKYSRPRPVSIIEVGHTQIHGELTIFVRDNGVGFSMKYAHKLFGVFHRLHRAEDFEGTGVGLATVQRIIKKHQGRVWAEAELDKGAAFYFTLGGGSQPGVPDEENMEVTTQV